MVDVLQGDNSSLALREGLKFEIELCYIYLWSYVVENNLLGMFTSEQEWFQG